MTAPTVVRRDAAPPPRSGTRRRWRAPALALAATLIAVLAVEVLLRLALPAGTVFTTDQLDGFLRTADSAACFDLDHELGHVPSAPSAEFDEFGLHRFELGRRTGPTVLYLGDSVTSRGRLIAPLAALTPWLRSRNGGIEAWNPVQEVAWFHRRQAGLPVDRVVLTLHVNDFEFTPLALWTADGFTISAPGAQASLWPGLYRWSWIYRLLVHARHNHLFAPVDQPAMAARVEHSLADLRDTLAARGAPLMLLVLPPFVAEAGWTAAERQMRQLVAAMCSRLAVRTIDLWEPVRQLLDLGVDVLEVAGDRWHPNDLAGRAMAGYALQQGLFDDWPATLRSACVALRNGEGAQELVIDAGPAYAGCEYRLAGTASGCTPGFVFEDVAVPLNPDTYLWQTIADAGEHQGGSVGRLDGAGRGRIRVAPGRLPGLATPVWLHHAAVIRRGDRAAMATNPVPLLIVP